MKKLVILLLVVSGFSCLSGDNIKLKENPDVLRTFNRQEINSLDLILHYFDNFILKSTKEHRINLAYAEYFKSLSNAKSFDNLRKQINLSADDLNSLIKTLKTNEIFKEIWQYEYNIDYKTKDTISVSLKYNLHGKYLYLLKRLGENNTYLTEYVDSIEECSCIPPSIISGFLQIYNKFNFNDEINRLIFAIHYITILYSEKYSDFSVGSQT